MLVRHPLALLLLALPAAAQEPTGPPVRLEYAFERLDGRTATYKVETEQTVGQEVEAVRADPEQGKLAGEGTTRVVERQVWRWAKGETPERGRVEIETESVSITVEENGKSRAYSSAAPKRAPERLRPLLARAGTKVTLVVERSGKLVSVEGVPPEGQAAWENALLLLPKEPIAPGTGWDRRKDEAMPPLGRIAWAFRYTLASAAEGKRRIELKLAAELTDAPGGEKRTWDADLRAQGGRGWLVLDADGLVVESLLESNLELAVKSATGVQIQRVRNRSRQALVTE